MRRVPYENKNKKVMSYSKSSRVFVRNLQAGIVGSRDSLFSLRPLCTPPAMTKKKKGLNPVTIFHQTTNKSLRESVKVKRESVR